MKISRCSDVQIIAILKSGLIRQAGCSAVPSAHHQLRDFAINSAANMAAWMPRSSPNCGNFLRQDENWHLKTLYAEAQLSTDLLK